MRDTVETFIVKIIIRLTLIAGVIGILWSGVGALIAKKEADRAAFAAVPPPLSAVSVEPAMLEVWQRYLPAVGSFTAAQDVMVTNEVEGKIVAIHFSSGQKIQQGDVLIQLDTSVDTAELQALAADEHLNNLQYERTKRLVADNTVSKSEFDIAAARRDEAAAMTRAKDAAVRKKTIRAPFSGILGIRRIDVGEYLDSGSEIVSLQSIDPIYLDFGTPERFIGEVSLGLSVTATVQGYPNEKFHGKITAFEPGIDRATRNLRMRAKFSNQNNRLRSGMFAEILSTLPRTDSVITIPETAVAYTPYGNSVYVVEDNDGVLRANRRQIETGQARDGRVAVTQGLAENESVVSVGHNKLRNGMPVQPQRASDPSTLSPE
ncbi:MAG: membrane fusion protein (multidrug efflux system) [Gammaproteobacteria bacterium]